MRKSLRTIQKNISFRLLKLHCTCPGEFFWANQLSRRKECFDFFFSDFRWTKNFGLFPEHFLGSFSKLDSSCLDNCFKELYFCGKEKFFECLVQKLSNIFSGVWLKTKKLVRLAKWQSTFPEEIYDGTYITRRKKVSVSIISKNILETLFFV